MRWIDYLPEIAREEPEIQVSDFTVLKLSDFETSAKELGLGNSYAIFMHSAFEQFLKVVQRGLGI